MKSKVSHKLFQFDVASFDASPIVRFATPYVAQQVSERLLMKETKGLYNFINYAKAYPSFASVRGDVFESAAHQLLCRGGTFGVRRLRDGHSSSLSMSFMSPLLFLTVRLAIPHLVKSGFKSIVDVKLTDNNTYAQPASSKFGAVDSLALLGNTLYGFQMTVSLEHPIKQQLVVDILDALKPEKLVLLFVVPEDCFGEFSLQPYLTKEGKVCQRVDKAVESKVEQWVLMLPIATS